MAFTFGSGRQLKFTKRPTKKAKEFASLPAAREKAQKFIAETIVKREFPKIISKELPSGFTGGANITAPKIVSSLKSGGFGQTKPTSKKTVRFGKDVQPKTELTASGVNTPNFGLRLIRHEIGHQVLGQQGVPDKAQEPIVRATKVAPITEQLKQLPAATLFFRTKGASRAAGFRSLFLAGGRRALQKKK
ncbi:MAG TPA: hypothetical protein ENI23_05370 [bacterium]|nr:hypothetical protein [bacterium]